MFKRPLSVVSGASFLLVGIFMLRFHKPVDAAMSAEFGTGIIVGIALGVGAGILIIRTLTDREFDRK